jgi:diguanylate cyclase (GGDEF)-like protein
MPDDATLSTGSRSPAKSSLGTAKILAAQFLTEAVLLVWLIFDLVANCLSSPNLAARLILDVNLAAVAAFLLYRRYRLTTRPLDKLMRILPAIQKGDAQIDSLATVDGQLAPLAAQIQQILQELREERGRLDQEVRQRIANRTSALERTIGSLRQQASRDILTALLNRRLFDECIQQAIARAKSGASNLSLLMIDVDNFKILNDTLGHQAGDDLLRSIGQLIRSAIRETDLAFRYGGDEFAILIENGNAEDAQTLAIRLIDLVDSLGKTYKLAKSPGLSVGVAHVDELTEITATALISTADKALYKLKGERKSSSQKNIARSNAA